MTRTASLAVLCFTLAACGRSPANAQRDLPPLPPKTASASAPSAIAAAPPATPAGERRMLFPDAPLGASEVIVVMPSVGAREREAPVLVAFHGRGESLRGAERGARGWLDDYGLRKAEERLRTPPLGREDFQGFVTAERLARLNGAIGESPYRGLVVVCPYLPDVLHGKNMLPEGALLAGFIVDVVLPRVRREVPAAAEATAVDGVSLGGRAALLVGLLRPKAFRVVGALQPAIDLEEIPVLSDLAVAARKDNPTLSVRLVTSDGDYFREPTVALSRALRGREVPALLDVVAGPHSYEWNRGPGVYEMLLFHDRALRGEKPASGQDVEPESR